MQPWVQIAFLSLAIALGSAVAFAPHIGEPLPLIADEYAHFSFAKHFLSDGGSLFVNPYFAPEVAHFNLESGFHLFLIAFVAVFGDTAEFYYRYLVIIFFAVNALLLFHLTRHLTNNYWAGLFAVLFFGTITSTNAILANEFFLPLTIGIGLLLASFSILHSWILTGDRRYGVGLALLLIAAALFYPPSLFFFLAVTTLYLLSMDHKIPETLGMTRSRFFGGLLVLLLTAGGLFVLLLHNLSLLQNIMFTMSWDIAHTRISPFFYFGVAASLFAVLGLLSVMKNSRKHAKIVVYWFVYGLAAIYAFYLFDLSILVPFPRLVIFYLLGASILAGIGAVTIARLLMRYAGQKIGGALFALIIIAVMGTRYYEAFSKQYPYPDLLDDATYETLMDLKQLTNRSVVIANSLHSRVIYPLTGNHVVGLLSANVGGGDPVAAQRFLAENCVEKVTTLEELHFYLQNSDDGLYVLAQVQQDCPFLRSLNKSAPYLYAIEEDALARYGISLATSSLQQDTQITLPETEILDEEALRELFVDNTFFGTDWVEYYASDGTINGRKDVHYRGYWGVEGSVYCYYYPISGIHSCRTVSMHEDTATFYDLNGDKTATARIVQGMQIE